MRTTARLLFALFALISVASAEWRAASPGWEFEFPRDHYAHDQFKTEWWYVTGRVETANGREYGYQITFFRQGLRPPGAGPDPISRFAPSALHFAHFAISDLDSDRFHFTQKVSRGAFEEAGNGKPGEPRLAWIDDWELRLTGEHAFAFRAEVDGIELELELHSTKPVVINGVDGVSRKGAGPGEATHYFSLTRMTASGHLRSREGKTQRVTGSSWLDREWGSNLLAESQIGWHWFSLQLDDGRELMLYQLRRADGSDDGHAAGTLVAEDGTSVHLEASEFALNPTRTWESRVTPGKYPVSWRIKVPGQALDLVVEAEFDAQELALKPVAYWEGAVRVTGSHRGRGYLEMTGYAAPLTVLRR